MLTLLAPFAPGPPLLPLLPPLILLYPFITPLIHNSPSKASVSFSTHIWPDILPFRYPNRKCKQSQMRDHSPIHLFNVWVILWAADTAHIDAMEVLSLLVVQPARNWEGKKRGDEWKRGGRANSKRGMTHGMDGEVNQPLEGWSRGGEKVSLTEVQKASKVRSAHPEGWLVGNRPPEGRLRGIGGEAGFSFTSISPGRADWQ